VIPKNYLFNGKENLVLFSQVGCETAERPLAHGVLHASVCSGLSLIPAGGAAANATIARPGEQDVSCRKSFAASHSWRAE